MVGAVIVSAVHAAPTKTSELPAAQLSEPENAKLHANKPIIARMLIDFVSRVASIFNASILTHHLVRCDSFILDLCVV